MRVVAGSAAGRRLEAPPGSGNRPTGDRVREATFNSLGSLGLVQDATMVDLFAGSGALGIEALSRGASEVTFVERDARAVRVVRANLATVGLAEPAEAHAQQEHREILAVLAERAVALDHLHLAAVHQPSAAGGHPDLADGLGDLGATLHGGQDLRVEAVDLRAQFVDIGQLIGGHIVVLLVWGWWRHSVDPFRLGLTQETSPGSGCGPRGCRIEQLHHGYREPVPVEKSELRWHMQSVPSGGVPTQRAVVRRR